MLEQQQGQLVAGLQETYKRLKNARAWSGPALTEHSGHPLTHDILSALNLLEARHDSTGQAESFEEDCQKLQSRLVAEGAGYVQRRGSISSDSDHSQHEQHYPTSVSTPTHNKPPVFRENFAFSASASPVTQSPVQRQRQSYPPAHSTPLQQSSPLSSDPQFYQAEWAIPDLSNPEQLLRSKFAMQVPELQHGLPDMDSIFVNNFDPQDAGFDTMSLTSFPHQMGNTFGMNDFALDPMDLEFAKYIQVTT